MRKLRRIFLALTALLLLALTWFLFFPVPVAWLANRILARELAAQNLSARVESATFRYRFWKPESELTIVSIQITNTAPAAPPPLAHATAIRIIIPKTGALHLPLAIPTLISIDTLGLSGTGFQPVDGAAAGSGGTGVSPVFRNKPPAFSTTLRINALTLATTFSNTNTTLAFSPIEATVSLAPDGTFHAATALALKPQSTVQSASARPPTLTLSADGSLPTARANIRATLSPFTHSDLPRIPLIAHPPHTAAATFAFNGATLNATIDLNRPFDALPLAFDFTASLSGAVFPLPHPLAKTPLRITTLALAAHSENNNLSLATATLRTPELTLDASGATLTTAQTASAPRHFTLPLKIAIADFPALARLAAPLLPSEIAQLPLDAPDLPLSLDIRAHGTLPDITPSAIQSFSLSALQSFNLSLSAGPGRIAPKPYCDADIPVTHIHLAANATAPFTTITLTAFDLALADNTIRLTTNATPLIFTFHPSLLTLSNISGALTLTGPEFPRDLRYWPEKVSPQLRDRLASTLQSARLESAAIAFDTPLAFPPRKLTADIRLASLNTASEKLDALRLQLDWPDATLTLANLRSPALAVSEATLQLTALDKPAPHAEATAHLSADIAKLPDWLNAWLATFDQPPLPALPPELKKLSGQAGITLRLSAPLPNFAPPPLADIHATATLATRALAMEIPGTLTGEFATKLTATLDGDKTLRIAGTLDTARLTFPHSEKLRPRRAPVAFDITLTNPTAPAPQLALTLASDDALPFSTALSLTTALRPGAPITADLTLGNTDLHATLTSASDLTLTSRRIDLPQLLPLAGQFFPGTPSSSSASSSRTHVPASPSTSTTPLRTLSIRAAEIHLTPNRRLHDLELAATFPVTTTTPAPFLVERAQLTAREGPANNIRITLAPWGASREDTAAPSHAIRLEIADTISLLSAITDTARQIPNLPADYAPTLQNLTDIHTTFSGGQLTLTGRIASPSPAADFPVFDGSFTLAGTTMLSPPRALQLLALKTKKKLQHAPLLELATVRRLRFSFPEIAIEQLDFSGAGLLNLKLAAAKYNLLTDALKADGTYYGIGFEVEGTTAAPQIYLKENIVTKTLGQQSDLHWGD